MMEKSMGAILSARVKELDFELLNVLQSFRIRSRRKLIRKMILDAGNLNFFLQQVSLIEEENDGYICKRFVVDDGFENVARLDETIRSPIFQERLVVLTGGNEE